MINVDPPQVSSDQYARRLPPAASASRRQLVFGGGLLVALLMPAFLALGFWQLRKAEGASAAQAGLEACAREAPREMPVTPATAETLHHRRFVLRGAYDADGQILLDNRIHHERAGYHVVTPLRLDGGDMHVLVNRGWVPAGDDRRVLPEVMPPAGRVEVTGIGVVPPRRTFTLGDPVVVWAGARVWQNLDFARLRAAAGHPLQPVVVRLDADAPGGYARDWPRADERATRHLGYAWQWFGFAAAAPAIWLFLLARRR